MYFVTSTAKEPRAGAVEVLEDLVAGRTPGMPFARVQLIGDPSVLGYYYTQQDFITRTLIASFPSTDMEATTEVVAGSMCDWLQPDAQRLGRLAWNLVVSPVGLHGVSAVREGYLLWARENNKLPNIKEGDIKELEAACAVHGLPSAVLALETVGTDAPDDRKPEYAALYFPLVTLPQFSLYSLQNALNRAAPASAPEP